MSRPSKQPAPAETTLRVGAFDYSIRLVRGAIHIDGEECSGLADFRAHEILISDEQCQAARWATLWHELAHAWHVVFHKGKTFIGLEAVAEFIEQGMAGIDAAALRRVQRVLTSKPREAAPSYTSGRRIAAKRTRKAARR